MQQSRSMDWSSLHMCIEDEFKDRSHQFNVGDLPPKSPEFFNMLPSLRPSPVLSSRNYEDDHLDSFHVVPSSYSANFDTHGNIGTYHQFLQQLQTIGTTTYDGSLTMSPRDSAVPGSFFDQETCDDLSGGEDLQIYLPNEISPTPVENLYSTLPNEKSPKVFAFPSFDENQRLENYDVFANSKNSTKTRCATRTLSGHENTVRNTIHHVDSKMSSKSISHKRKSHGFAKQNFLVKTKHKFVEVDSMSNADKLTHNDIERQRRNDMKGRFDALKATIPDIQDMERTPKILILSKAKDFINQLHTEEKRLDAEKERERKRNRVLLERLVSLTNV